MNFVRKIFNNNLTIRAIYHNTQNQFILQNLNCNFKRLKHSSNHYKGVKGKPQIKKFNHVLESRRVDEDAEPQNVDIENDSEYDSIASMTMHVTKTTADNEQNVIIIQPFIKWGPKKDGDTKPELQLQEAEALIRSLPNWSIQHSLKVALESLEKKTLFGKGKMEELLQLLKSLRSAGKNISSIFISKGQLTAIQKQTLEKQFGLPVLDRYSVVIQILRLHAVSMEAKLQVAMAEIPYIWSQMRDIEAASSSKLMLQSNFHLNDSRKQLLRNRERKLKTELDHIRQHRKLLRQKRKHKNYPIIAVVGYTNAGKTSLIKALTGEKGLQPRNQLFATLDVTAHAAFLPCKLEVLYMDTVGFMSDIPTGLIECFVATLEDAMLADLIIHVQDLSHENLVVQRKHVEETLLKLQNIDNDSRPTKQNEAPLPDNIINVGNKIDCIKQMDPNVLAGLDCSVSSLTGEGLNDLLATVEQKILKLTNRMKIVIKVPMGGEEMQWLYKNASVTESAADPKDSQRILLNCIISDVSLNQFKHYFVK